MWSGDDLVAILFCVDRTVSARHEPVLRFDDRIVGPPLPTKSTIQRHWNREHDSVFHTSTLQDGTERIAIHSSEFCQLPYITNRCVAGRLTCFLRSSRLARYLVKRVKKLGVEDRRN